MLSSFLFSIILQHHRNFIRHVLRSQQPKSCHVRDNPEARKKRQNEQVHSTTQTDTNLVFHRAMKSDNSSLNPCKASARAANSFINIFSFLDMPPREWTFFFAISLRLCFIPVLRSNQGLPDAVKRKEL